MKNVFFVLILIIIGFSFFLNSYLPLIADSGFYTQIANMIRTERLIYTPAQIACAGTSHPYLIPLLYACFGRVIIPILFVSMLGYFFWLTRSIIFTFILATFPLIFMHSTQLYCDFPLAFFHLITVSMLWRYMRDEKLVNLLLAIFASVLCWQTKASGLPLIIIAWSVFVLWWINNLTFNFRTKLAMGILMFFLVLKPQLNKLNFLSLLVFNNINVPTYNIIIYHNPIVFWFLFSAKLFTYADWGLLWYAVIIFSVFNARAIITTNLKYLLAIIILDILMIYYVLYQPQYYIYLVDGTLVQRLVMHIAPTALFYCWLLTESQKN